MFLMTDSLAIGARFIVDLRRLVVHVLATNILASASSWGKESPNYSSLEMYLLDVPTYGTVPTYLSICFLTVAYSEMID